MAIFNIDEFRLENLEFFCDKRLDNINVYSVILVTNSVDFDLIITDFTLCMKNYSIVQIIQQSADDYIRFTFVSYVNCLNFNKFLNKIVAKLCFAYKCQINIL